MMGAGKTAVGTEVARLLGRPYTDSDDEIERAANMTITEIFARDGEEFFRARESEVLARILAGPPGIVSTGGGAWIRPENRRIIRAGGVSVWIDADLETLWNRVRLRATRPLLMTPNPHETLAAMVDQRRPVYAKADLRLLTSDRDTVDGTARRMIEMLAANGFLTKGEGNAR
ncbi:shikimate kinase [Paracoccus pacificus]|uniref:Shikimate kinase n=1 Tax=Paracoccus pacificus TaxID=1463598 RepID=A0ABW4R476_9RHOB